MMNHPVEFQTSACVNHAVQPLLADLREAVQVEYCGAFGPNRPMLERFIHDMFEQAYGAQLSNFYPNLTAFRSAGRIRGVMGYRDGMVKPLFSEQYLDQPVEAVMSTHLGQAVERRQLVEVGNLAMATPGEARWLIAAATVFLHAAGYRWVLFTAVKPLFNAFQRLGLQPMVIATPDPCRLPDGGRNWGSYYQAGPRVCAGDIDAGYHQLRGRASDCQPYLQTLLREARRLGYISRHGDDRTVREAM